jgi:hypothetical protein
VIERLRGGTKKLDKIAGRVLEYRAAAEARAVKKALDKEG